MKKCVIVAPHADDEIIGCYEVMTAKNVKIHEILFGSREALKEAVLKEEYLDISMGMAEKVDFEKYPSDLILLFPDPIYEFHPMHRMWGAVGEKLLRQGKTVVFYSVNMQAPYIHEVKSPKAKRKYLNTLYPEKNSLWENDNKYFLFEGYTEWKIKI